MSVEHPDVEAVAALLRQQGELGAGEWVLERLSRAEALGLAGRVRRAEASSPPFPDAGPPDPPTRPAPPAERSSDATAGAAAPPANAPPPRAGPTPSAASSPRAGSAPSAASPPGAKPTPSAAPSRNAAVPSDTSSPPDADAATGTPDFEPPADYDALRRAAMVCTRCRLAGDRTQVVFSDGARDARVMVVGEAPGANEDRTGLPFVGAAGKLLDLLLAGVDLSRRESVYICNVLKCRPPGNRNPRPDEIEACAPWLHRQIELVAPEVILAVGTFAGQLLTGRDMALGRLRGEVYSYRGTPLVVTYHPAALLRNSGWTRAAWDDLQLLRQVLDDS